MNKLICKNIAPNMLILRLPGMVVLVEDVQSTIRLRKLGFVIHNSQYSLALLN